ncbi:hypothetical protein EGT41_08920 [Burkholderia cenocepacia]|uniref:Uncharacterized protein n=1 Tax=Burkholderia cenocepacia TaxID=95486 RepID=A0A427P1L0_9BURK|nr:hypothetical protein EGT41_08920 [Burkholderia cenocepacia]
MIAIFRKSAVDLRKNGRDRPCIAFVKTGSDRRGPAAGQPSDRRCRSAVSRPGRSAGLTVGG